jgi:hypothetical protein
VVDVEHRKSVEAKRIFILKKIYKYIFERTGPGGGGGGIKSIID